MILPRVTKESQETVCHFDEKLEVAGDQIDEWSENCSPYLPYRSEHAPLHHSMPQFPCTAKVRCSPPRSLPRSPRVRALANVLTIDDCITSISLDDDEDEPTQFSSSQTLAGKHAASQPRPSLQLTIGRDRSHTNSLFSVLSAPSKIGRSTTQHYLFSPASVASFHDDQGMLETMSFGQVKKGRPSKRGICNTMTILVVVAVILFLFAGYPLTLYITKEMQSQKKAQVS